MNLQSPAGHGRAPRSAPVAAFLSFLWPGLGQAYLGDNRVALLFAAPMFAVVALVIWQFAGGIDRVAVSLIAPSVAATVALLGIVLAAWRIASIIHAFATAPRRVVTGGSTGDGPAAPRSTRGSLTVVVLVLAVLAVHVPLAWGAAAVYETGSRIFSAWTPPSPGPAPGGSVVPSSIASPSPPPSLDASSRVNVLLLGVDSGMGYDHSLSDTMMVVSVDPTTRNVAMLSIPRDLARFPMYSGGTYPGKLNGLMTDAQADPARFPDGGIGTLEREIGYLLGVPIHYYALVDLAGFKAMIDAVGGVDVVNERAIADPAYGFPDGKVGFFLKAGLQHLNGRTALAYVRSRMGAGDNDFTRAGRQQQLLVALRDKLTKPDMIVNLPKILDALGNTIRTDYPPDRLGDLLDLSKLVAGGDVRHVVLGPPYARNPPASASGGTYMLVPDMARFAKLSVDVFGPDSAYAPVTPSPSP